MLPSLFKKKFNSCNTSNDLAILSFQEKKKEEKEKEGRIRDVYFPSHVLTNELHPVQKLIPVYHEITLEWCAPPRPVPRTRKTLNHFPSRSSPLFIPRPPMSRMAGRVGEEGLSDTHLCATSHRSSQANLRRITQQPV